MDLVALNQALFDEFHRITGSTNRFIYPRWCAAVTREVIASLHDKYETAVARWGRLNKLEQRTLLFRHLRAKPPAGGPDLRVIAGGAYVDAGTRGHLQAILDGVPNASRAA